MRTTKQMSITVPLEMADMVRAKVDSGEYASESEVIREGLRALAERDEAVERWLRHEVIPALRTSPRRPIATADRRPGSSTARRLSSSVTYSLRITQEASEQLVSLQRYISAQATPEKPRTTSHNRVRILEPVRRSCTASNPAHARQGQATPAPANHRNTARVSRRKGSGARLARWAYRPSPWAGPPSMIRWPTTHSEKASG